MFRYHAGRDDDQNKFVLSHMYGKKHCVHFSNEIVLMIKSLHLWDDNRGDQWQIHDMPDSGGNLKCGAAKLLFGQLIILTKWP